MWKDFRTSIKEYTPTISKQWWGYIEMWGSIIALIVGITGFIFWAKNTTPPMPIWTIVLIAGCATSFVIVNFLAFNKVRIERDKAITELSRQPELMPLSNRDELLRAITEGRIATIEFVKGVEDLMKWEKLHPNLVNIEAMTTINNAQQRQRKAFDEMEKEILVAGSDYEPILKPLYLFMQTSAILNASPTENQSTILTYKFKLEEIITQTRNKITELSNPTSHKEGSQD